ncbi:MAG: class I SAM-dependent methyltransferase [Phycisphaerales bacterium]|nr:MAG: class I SAM-dependent methyltransferase [Phycisphaerales bacterium]
MASLIQRHSTNQADVREAVLAGLDISSAKNVLDLGCGFGFMAEAIASRVAPEAHFTGVDVWQSNALPFCRKVLSTGRRASFTCMQIGSKLPWPGGSFDLVSSSYALYFFAEVLPDIARVLTPEGLFVSVTHSERSLVDLLCMAGLPEAGSRWTKLMRGFSAENGEALLERHFGEVRRIDYHNALKFTPETAGDLMTFIQFKLQLLSPESNPQNHPPEALRRFVEEVLPCMGEVVVEKNDAAFHCRRPRCH